ncbi:MAG: hypothetical protein VXX23_01690, partial [Actinomycetota bacterium]|nr:hypothetical protein [Actinomycetota bacterium]
GDLLKSNYSKFGLARIFGTPDMEDSDATALTQDAWNTIIEQTEDVKSYLDGKAVPEYAKPPLLGPLTTEFTTMREVEVLALKDEKSKIRKVKLPPGLNIKITSINPTVESLAKFLETGDLDDISSFGIAEVEVSGPSWEGFFRKGVDNAEDVTRYNTFKAGLAMRGLSEKDIIIPHYLLAKPGIFKPNPVKVPDPPADAPSTTTTSDLLSSENNPFVRAFESTRGRGLAGFITQMDFQWLDQVTWETAPGSKAPKTCVVTISFSPVHDIGPGTDHRGMNRAPIYNVGRSVKHLGRDPYDDES